MNEQNNENNIASDIGSIDINAAEPAVPDAQDVKELSDETDKPGDVQDKKKQKKQRSPMNPIQLFLLNAIIIVTLIWLMFGFVFGLKITSSSDMNPNIKANDMLLYYQLDRSFHPQDVVVLKKNNTIYVGRIIACGGDTVEISDDNKLIINGDTMIETNIYSITPRYEGFVEYPLSLGKGEYFILVDSRNGGTDSRYYGKVSDSEIQGKVITVLRRSNL